MPNHRGRLRKRVDSGIFLARYLLALQHHRREPIDVSIVTNFLHRVFPWATIVGDKWPRYIFMLDKLAAIEDLYRVAIYRDCRDVVRSRIEQRRGNGKSIPTVQIIVKAWVQAIEMMEQHCDKVHIIRYEDLVSDPQPVLETLGNWLGVDPQGFRHRMIRPTSVGKYKQGLSEKEVADIIAVAGPTMQRLGYEV
jgi:hypothetical protein